MDVRTEDITVPWSQAPDPSEQQYGSWRLAVFQDVQESRDGSKLYFLYDPIADDNCITTGGRKGTTCFAVFDNNRKCFVAQIILRVQGRVKFVFAVPKASSNGGGDQFVLVTQSEDYGTFTCHFWKLTLSHDGLNLAHEPTSLLTAPVAFEGDFICSMRDDAPEIVFVHSPGMNITRIAADATSPREPIERFSVPNAELGHFYDGFLHGGNIYFLSASPDEQLDYTRVHILSLQTRQITTQYCKPDISRGMPPTRRQAGLDCFGGYIILAGGELDYGDGNVTRLVDYWVLDLSSFTWAQVGSQMPLPLIEPRVTAGQSGSVYIWGDYDQPLPGMPASGTHLRILRVAMNLKPPSYDQAMNYPSSTPSYPQPNQPGNYPSPDNQSGGYGQSGQGGYGFNQPQGYSSPPMGQGGYNQPQGGYNQSQGGYNQPQGGYNTPPVGQGGYPQNPQDSFGPPPQGTFPGQQQPQYPHYPPQEKKKDCSIM
jgi:hypothetical protein